MALSQNCNFWELTAPKLTSRQTNQIPPAKILHSPETASESARRFHDPRLEWQRLFAEFWGPETAPPKA